MNMMFNSFVGAFGLLLLFTTGVTAWVFRSSTAPIAAKLTVPACLVLLAVATPFQVLTIMGYPIPSNMRDLPQRAELVAFLPYDGEKRVDLWLRDGAGQPRAYDIEMTAEMKKTLKAAQGEKAEGKRVGLVKKGKPGARRHSYIDIDGGEAPYTIDPDAFALPKKGEPQ